jgi:mono/diheme cytochrome c family protein
MKLSGEAVKWLSWLILTIAIAFWLGYSMFSEESDKTIFMPGALSAGHHQLADACDACHIDSFGGGEVLQQSCIDCHGEDRVKPFDSHPAKKFKDPRNAELLENINALSCISCHTEHKPEITKKDGLTQPVDFCVHCHQEVAEERPSHEGMDFTTCKDSGCHNFHNNRALYTDYLIKHLHEQPLLPKTILPEKEFASILDEVVEYPREKYPVQNLDEVDIDAAQYLDARSSQKDAAIKQEWLKSGHAESGVNCTACHVAQGDENESKGDKSDKGDEWIDSPDHSSCATCHSVEVERFTQGKHGMRLKQGLTAMTPEHARLPMKQEASHQQLTCNSCHGAHQYDVQQAAVESCLGCHDDKHSLAYKQSPHYDLWLSEINGETEPGTGVSCASCHMPRVNHDVSEWMSRTIVDHNQSANLSPNTKMIRSSCQHCHGLEFVLDTLADEAQIEANFNGHTEKHIPTMDLADREKQRRDEAASDDDASMFGF